MNKFIIVALVASLACIVLAAEVPIIRQSFDIEVDGSYSFGYEIGDHTSVEERGLGGHYANGKYSYISPEGENIEVAYVADENGFQPSGSHVPEIPEAIVRALEWVRTHPPHE